MVSIVSVHAPLGDAVARLREARAFVGVASRPAWLRDVSVDVVCRCEFVLAMVASMVVGTAALVSALMGSTTVVTAAVVRVTYVGVVLMAVIACAVLLLVEAGIEGAGPLAASAEEVDRDALYASSLGLAATVLVVCRMSLVAGALAAPAAAGCLVGQFAFVAGARDLRRIARVAAFHATATLAYLGCELIGAGDPCLDCIRGPWILAVLGVGFMAGVACGWSARRVPVATRWQRLVGFGATLFVMAATIFLVREEVRATFTVMSILVPSVAAAIPQRVLDRSRAVAIDAAYLILAGFEVLASPEGTVPVGLVALIVRAFMRVPRGWPRAVAAVTVTVVAVALCVNVVPPWDEIHHSFFLFPMRDVAAGKSLLVDVNAQYGVGLIYVLSFLAGGTVEGVTESWPSVWWGVAVYVAFWITCARLARNRVIATLAGIFLAMNHIVHLALFGNFTVVVSKITPDILSTWTNVANIALYVGLWAMCAWLLHDWAGAAVFWLAVLTNRSLQLGSAESYPSTGVWRFGLAWFLVVDALAYRHRMDVSRRLLRVGYWAVASTWSLEVALYSAVVLAVDLAIDGAIGWRHLDDTGARLRLANRLGEVLLGVTSGFLILEAVTRWRSGNWADPDHYLEYFGTYGAGLGFSQPEPWAAWSPMLIGCAGAMVIFGVRAVLGKVGEPARRDSRALALVGAYGVAQFTYYVYRSHPNNLLHVMFPSAVLVVYLLSRSWQRLAERTHVSGTPGTRIIVHASLLGVVALLGASGLTATVPRVQDTVLGHVGRLWFIGDALTEPWFQANTQQDVGNRVALRSLLSRRFPNVPRVPMLLADDLWIHAIVGTSYVNRFPLSFEQQDGLIPTGVSVAIASARNLPLGTDMVVETDLSRLNGLRRDIAVETCVRGRLVPDEWSARVVMVRLVTRGSSDQPDLCHLWGLTASP